MSLLCPQMLAQQRSYREVANLLDAVKQFMTHFDQYVHIPVIQNIQQRVAAIRADLTQQISAIFRQLAQVLCSAILHLHVLAACCTDRMQHVSITRSKVVPRC